MKINRTSVLNALSSQIGRENGLTCKQLANRLVGGPSGAGDERQIRSVIEELRLEGYHICGLPGAGYYMARTEDDLNDTCLFLYGRSMTTLKQISAMKRVSMPDLKGQLHLPT